MLHEHAEMPLADAPILVKRLVERAGVATAYAAAGVDEAALGAFAEDAYAHYAGALNLLCPKKFASAAELLEMLRAEVETK